MRERGDFLESAEVHGNHYGTSRRWIVEQMAAGRDILLEIDWQGAQQVRGLFHAASAFSSCRPRWRAGAAPARARPGQRGRHRPPRGRRPGRNAPCGEFDYVIINNKLPEAIEDLQTVVRAVRLRTASQLDRHRALFSFLEQDT
jgi:guanylate kinase